MKVLQPALVSCLLAAVSSAPALAAPDGPATAAAQAAPGLVLVQPFTLDRPTVYRWSADGRAVDNGYVMVLLVDPSVARPRQGPHPVLYVGDTPAERLSWSSTAPYLVILVPGPLDLSLMPVYWGDSRLPERADASHGADLLAATLVVPFTQAQLDSAILPPLAAADIGALYTAVEPLVRQYAPLDGPVQ